MYGSELASHMNEYPSSTRRRPTLNTMGVEGKTRAFETLLSAVTWMWAVKAAEATPLAVDNDTAMLTGKSGMEDVLAVC